MIALIVSAFLGWFGKWRYLGLVYLLGLLVFGTAGLVGGGAEPALYIIPLEPLVEVLLGYAGGAALYRLRKGSWPRDTAVAALQDAVEIDPEPASPSVRWEAETPVLNYPAIRVLLIVLAILFVFVFALFAFLRPGKPFEALAIAGIGIGGLVGLFVIVVFGILMNRLRRRYTVTEQGYTSEITDGRIAWAMAGSTAAGASSSDATTAGAGLVAASNLTEAQSWQSAEEIVLDPRRRRIKLKLGRRGWDILYCTPNAYEVVAGRVGEYAAKKPAASSQQSSSANKFSAGDGG